MEERSLQEIRDELRAIRALLQQQPHAPTEEERHQILELLDEIGRRAEKRRVNLDSTQLIREDRDR